VDANQPDIVKALRDVPGLSVAVTHMLGNGYPDLTLGWRGQTYMVELKIGPKEPLTKDQRRFHREWTGHLIVAWDARQILEAIGAVDWDQKSECDEGVL
jgi:hypothetical protein